jgi:Rrf2 family nitric oxide-sensitive transcriptional repressor
MKLSLYTDYGLRTLMFLAAHDGRHSVAEIAAAFDISRNHLTKVVQQLVNEGFVEGVRGRGGGLQLAVPASELNLGRIVRRMEGLGGFVECFNRETNRCVITPVCGLRKVMRGALDAFVLHLDQYSIADLVGEPETFRKVFAHQPH